MESKLEAPVQVFVQKLFHAWWQEWLAIYSDVSYKTAEFCSMCGPKFCPMQTKVDADALTELEKFLAKEPVAQR